MLVCTRFGAAQWGQAWCHTVMPRRTDAGFAACQVCHISLMCDGLASLAFALLKPRFHLRGTV
jgi:hypothetical protein